MKRLMGILSLKRCYKTAGEQAMITQFIAPYEPMEYRNEQGEVMAYAVDIPQSDGESSSVLFSCHTDTVHGSQESSGEAVNAAVFDPELQVFYKEDDSPLGADDGAGVWLMLEMIDAKVPGFYVFHRGEEKGGVGSSFLAKKLPELVGQFKWAIAFDRRGTSSVITHQGFGKCCSTEFAQALADQLNAAGLELAPDATGVYTDTAEYVDLVPECTNLSVGYDFEHSKQEILDCEYLLKLRDAMVGCFDEKSLPVVREPGDDGYGDEDGYRTRWGWISPGPVRDEFDLAGMSHHEIRSYVETADPSDVADLLMYLSERLTGETDNYDTDHLRVGLQ